MTGPDADLTDEQLDRVRAVAAVLLPGTTDIPSPDAIADFDELVRAAAAAISGGGREVVSAIAALDDDISWASLSAFAERDRASFDEVALLAVGAYYMSRSVLESLGLPSGERRPASREQVVDELDSGILDAVLERGCPVRSLEEVNETSAR